MRRILSLFLFVAALCLFCTLRASAQTTTLMQTGPDHCVVNGCINAPLSDGELYTWSDTIRTLGQKTFLGKLAFRGLNYDMSGQTSGNLTIDESATENNGFAVHADYDTDCFRCGLQWDDGYLQLNREYVGSDPGLYGWNGAKNITSGTGQVGVVTASPSDQAVMLTSSDPTQVQVPASVTILAGSLDANFTITATAPTQPTSPPYLTEAFITITATFPDGTSSTATVGVEPLPAPTPPDSKLVYPCGSKMWDCLRDKPKIVLGYRSDWATN